MNARRRRALVAVALLLGALLAWLGLRNRRTVEDGDAVPAAPPAATPPASLAPRPGAAPRENDDEALTEARAPSAPSRSAASAAPRERSRVAPRLVLDPADGSDRPLAIRRVLVDLAPAPFDSGFVEVYAGSVVHFEVDDPRAAARVVFAEVPSPVPDAWTLSVPSREHPLARDLVLEVVDRRTKEPVPGALVVPIDGLGAVAVADERGRAVLLRTEGSALEGLPARRYDVQAEGYEFGSFEHRDLNVLGPALSLDLFVSAAARGAWRVELVAERKDLARLAVRIVDADGRPVEGTIINVVFGATRRQVESAGLTVSRRHVSIGYQATKSAGVVRFPAAPVVGLEWIVDGVAVMRWALATSAWDTSKPRDVRLPGLADAEVSLVGLPVDSSVSWGLDPVSAKLGAARTIADGTPAPHFADREIEGRLAAGEIVVAFDPLSRDPKGATASPIRLKLPVGYPTTIYLSDGRRTPPITPEKPGPYRVTFRADELLRDDAR